MSALQEVEPETQHKPATRNLKRITRLTFAATDF